MKKILAKKYVDIRELLPETWQLKAENYCYHSKKPCRSLVTDISLWTKCYTIIVVILAAAFLDKTAHFFT